MKKILFLAITVLTVIPMLFLTSCRKIAGVIDKTVGNYVYTLTDDDEAVITHYTGSFTRVEIPEKIDGYTVTEIAENAFNKEGLKSVVIPASVKRVASNAFSACVALQDVTIKGKDTAVNGAFSKCVSLEKVTFTAKTSRFPLVLFRIARG